VIPNGVDTSAFYPDDACLARHPVVLFVGTWSGRKRGNLLARTFVDGVLPRIPDAELWMVSDDIPSDHHPAVHALGRVGNDRLANLYRQAWVFCLPSSYEGFGIPYAEAMASGLPVVATPNVGARYVTNDGRAGVLVDPGALGDELVRLLGDSHRRAQLTVEGLRRSHDFSLQTVVDDYEQLYLETMAGRLN
jgi:glycosyltransferase involved in cell wall biosynthesis